MRQGPGREEVLEEEAAGICHFHPTMNSDEQQVQYLWQVSLQNAVGMWVGDGNGAS